MGACLPAFAAMHPGFLLPSHKAQAQVRRALQLSKTAVLHIIAAAVLGGAYRAALGRWGAARAPADGHCRGWEHSTARLNNATNPLQHIAGILCLHSHIMVVPVASKPMSMTLRPWRPLLRVSRSGLPSAKGLYSPPHARRRACSLLARAQNGGQPPEEQDGQPKTTEPERLLMLLVR